VSRELLREKSLPALILLKRFAVVRLEILRHQPDERGRLPHRKLATVGQGRRPWRRRQIIRNRTGIPWKQLRCLVPMVEKRPARLRSVFSANRGCNAPDTFVSQTHIFEAVRLELLRL